MTFEIGRDACFVVCCLEYFFFLMILNLCFDWLRINAGGPVGSTTESPFLHTSHF